MKDDLKNAVASCPSPLNGEKAGVRGVKVERFISL